MLTAKPECLQEMATSAEGICVSCGSGMFRQVLQAVTFLSKEKIIAKVDYLKKMFRWSDAEVSIA
jgi:mTERF domain-containing protein